MAAQVLEGIQIMGDMGNEFAEATHSPRGRSWRGPQQRPHIRPPMTAGERVAIGVTIVGLLTTLVPLVIWYPGLPDTVATHFGFNGQANAYGPKATLLIFPAIALLLTILFQTLCHFPWTFNYPVRITAENAARQYTRGRLLLRWVNATVWLFSFIEWQAIQAAGSPTPSLSPAFTVVLLFAALVMPAVLIGAVILWRVRGR